ncbi:site-specific integrase [Brevibacillus agri]|uniref:tyrosine-type recombinase/integrase n=1 Tax=Paenibacillaceae TaxID=186822 RepID=UPI0002A5206D|nr:MULTISPECIES: site-specific integrase [Paenibacillaceae]ELK43460.1 integrase [Brevibacillus agri BAB-2500]MCM3622765.1 site-specific integrase [Brevibacillus borstelensis]
MANYRQRGNNSWELTVSLGRGANGKYTRRTKTVTVEDERILRAPKRLEMYLEQEWLKFKEEVEAGHYIAPAKLTFNQFVELWKEKYAVNHLERKTLYSYMVNLNSHILPAFGGLQLDQIKPLHIVDFLESLGKVGNRKDDKAGALSSGTIQMNHRVLKNIFSRAVEWKVIKENPAAEVKKPKVAHKEIIPYDDAEVRTMLQALQKEPYHWRMMITLALTTGMRRGELLGLEWKHIDWKTGVIDVQQSVAISLKGEVIVKEPKTKNSKRKVALPPSVLEELREYYSYRVKERDKIGDAWQGGKQFFVFAHADGRAFHHERPYLWFRQFIKKNGFRYIRFHDLRHTSATMLINQGVHAKVISERLGHGSITTTMNIYGHALRSADQAAADKFENLFTLDAKQADKKTLG